MKFELPPLPYATDALEPHISKRTMEFHYGKHHKGYVDKLNALIAGTQYEEMSLEDILLASKDDKSAKKIYNNAAQDWNHTFFWNCMSPNHSAGPSSSLRQRIDAEFGSFDAFKEKFETAGKDLFGSGWTWLVKSEDGGLAIRALPNARNPLNDGEVPLLVCDVWEHAYYLDYQNERAKFLKAFWNLVHWEFVDSRFVETSNYRSGRGGAFIEPNYPM